MKPRDVQLSEINERCIIANRSVDHLSDCQCTWCISKRRLLRQAYREGQDSVADRDAECPYGEHASLLDAALVESWEEGREHAEEEMADEYAQFCDPSMRDLYE